MFVREFDEGAAGAIPLALVAGSEKSQVFGKFPARNRKYDVWSGVIASNMFNAVLEAPRLQIEEGSSSPDGKTNTSIIDIDNSGFQQAWTQLLPLCSTAPAPTPVAVPTPTPARPVLAPAGLSAAITSPAVVSAPPVVASPAPVSIPAQLNAGGK
jgi:hypothetical protein